MAYHDGAKTTVKSCSKCHKAWDGKLSENERIRVRSAVMAGRCPYCNETLSAMALPPDSRWQPLEGHTVKRLPVAYDPARHQVRVVVRHHGVQKVEIVDLPPPKQE